nr:sugar phosphate isomerase/epimerase [uncultured Flavobacterium sp.]
MIINFFCPRWGSEDLNWDDFFEKVKSAGYDGIEWAIGKNISFEEIKSVVEKAELSELLVIAQHFDTDTANFDEHLQLYKEWFSKISNFKFYCINSQTGKDFFSEEQNNKLLAEAKNTEKMVGVPIYHETHRNKFSFAAHITSKFLENDSELKLTLDASHWVNVAESYLDDQKEVMNLAISRTEHIHARIGHTEAAQVSDPFAPEWQFALEKYLEWWDAIVNRKKNQSNEEKISITPEFGPAPYMFIQPYTKQPVVNQWDINKKMLDFLKIRYTK